MEISGVPLYDFEHITHGVSNARYDGNVIMHPDARDLYGVRKPRIRARLYVQSSRGLGARRSSSGRRMPAACWHAYRDVLAEMFRQFPEATVRTGMATYKGRSGFLAQYPATAYQNIGSMMNPAHMPDMCECSTDNGRARPMAEHVDMMYNGLRESTEGIEEALREIHARTPLVPAPDTVPVTLAEADRVLALAQAQTPEAWLLTAFEQGIDSTDYANYAEV